MARFTLRAKPPRKAVHDRPFLAIVLGTPVAAPGAVAIDGKQGQSRLRLAVTPGGRAC
jgi:hypothetical protein